MQGSMKVSKGAKIRNRYNQVPHLTQDTNKKVATYKLFSIFWLVSEAEQASLSLNLAFVIHFKDF